MLVSYNPTELLIDKSGRLPTNIHASFMEQGDGNSNVHLVAFREVSPKQFAAKLLV